MEFDLGDLNSPKIIVALLQVEAEPWKSIFEHGQLPTWIKNSSSSAKIINIYGKAPSKFIRLLDLAHERLRWSPALQGPIHILDRKLTPTLLKLLNTKSRISEDNNTLNIHVDVPSMHLTLPVVEFALFKYFIEETTSDFLYMSNSSSYVNIENLLNFVSNLSPFEIYGGTMNTFAGIDYASGSNRIISRDLVKYVIDNFDQWDFTYVEDVSLGKILEGKYSKNPKIKSLTLESENEIENLSSGTIKATIHFRLKSGSLKSRSDARLMRHVHKVVSAN